MLQPEKMRPSSVRIAAPDREFRIGRIGPGHRRPIPSSGRGRRSARGRARLLAGAVEDGWFPEGWCAETTALGHYVMAGGGPSAVAVVAERGGVSSAAAAGASFRRGPAGLYLCDETAWSRRCGWAICCPMASPARCCGDGSGQAPGLAARRPCPRPGAWPLPSPQHLAGEARSGCISPTAARPASVV